MAGHHDRMKPKEKVEHPFRILGRVMKLMLKNYKVLFIIVLACIIVSAGASLMGTLFEQTLIDDYITPLIGVSNPDFAPLLAAILKLAGIFLIGIIAAYGQKKIMVTIGQGTLKNFRDEVFEHMETLPLKYFDSRTHGSVMSIYVNDIDTVKHFITETIPEMFQTAFTVCITLVSMIVMSPLLTLVSLAMIGVSFLVTGKVGKSSSKYFMAQQQNLAGVNGYVEEMINGQKVVKVFCREDKCVEEFDEKNEALRFSAHKANGIANILMPINGNIGHISYVLIAIIGATLAISGKWGGLTLGTIVSFLGLNKSFSRPIHQLSSQINTIVTALAGANRVFELLDEESEIDNGDVTLVRVDDDMHETSKRTGKWAWKVPNYADSQSDNLAIANGIADQGTVTTFTLVPLLGDVRFNDVDFSYKPERQILFDINLYAKPGQKIAFVGSTGAGKTTITNLINRFYDIQDGEILYDGIDVKRIKKSDLRHSLGIVLQETNLFSGTVMENIRYGRLDATDEECINAAKLANADSFIRRLPEGYNTMLIGDGSNLSQGQRQLLSIARAAVADPPVLILDEATSSVDTRTESYVQKGMDGIMAGRTTFVIAHRLSTVMNSDCIMVLENGHIIERGTHEELLEEKGRYYTLYTGNKVEE